VFIAVASGVPFVDYWVPGVERLLEPGRDWWLAHGQNVIVHEYFGIDLDVVWNVIEINLPSLRKRVQEILDREG
jgi:hypothetical protein